MTGVHEILVGSNLVDLAVNTLRGQKPRCRTRGHIQKSLITKSDDPRAISACQQFCGFRIGYPRVESTQFIYSMLHPRHAMGFKKRVSLSRKFHVQFHLKIVIAIICNSCHNIFIINCNVEFTRLPVNQLSYKIICTLFHSKSHVSFTWYVTRYFELTTKLTICVISSQNFI